MTRDEQIKAALEVISPPPDEREQCRGNIEYMLDSMAAARGTNAAAKSTRAKAGGRAWRAHHLALRRLLATHDKLTAEGWGYLGKIERTVIERAIAATTDEQYRKRRAEIEIMLDFVGPGQAHAVALACDLLMQWWNNAELITTTRNGPWWRLSAIFYGDPDANLFRYLRAFSNTPGAKISQQVY